MSKELDEKIDGAITKLVQDARVPISMGNGRAKVRTAQEVALSVLQVTKALNKNQEVTEAKLAELEAELNAEIAKAEGA